DVIVVDEASMVSLALMASLLEAVRTDARLVLIGDPEQLVSVEAGAVLADIVGPAGGGAGGGWGGGGGGGGGGRGGGGAGGRGAGGGVERRGAGGGVERRGAGGGVERRGAGGVERRGAGWRWAGTAAGRIPVKLGTGSKHRGAAHQPSVLRCACRPRVGGPRR